MNLFLIMKFPVLLFLFLFISYTSAQQDALKGDIPEIQGAENFEKKDSKQQSLEARKELIRQKLHDKLSGMSEEDKEKFAQRLQKQTEKKARNQERSEKILEEKEMRKGHSDLQEKQQVRIEKREQRKEQYDKKLENRLKRRDDGTLDRPKKRVGPNPK